MYPRHLLSWALDDAMLRGRMCFIAGPRQIGKTTAVQKFLERQGGLYYNWDGPAVKKRYALNPLFFLEDLKGESSRSWVSLDEIHKYPKWKNVLKGYYDEWKQKIQFIVTGSARLDLFRKSGDSLVGRYFLFRMLPLGPREAAGLDPSPPPQWPFENGREPAIPLAPPEIATALESLLKLSGYPEPLAAGSETFCQRWRENHVSLVIREDLRDLTKIFQIQKLETLLYLLPGKVGSPLSLNALRQSLECAHGSVQAWLGAMEAVYLTFSIPPWTARLARSVLKEKKYYFWDWGLVDHPGARFENFLAVQLERAVSCWNENGLGPLRLYYLRTKDGLETDFAIAGREKILFLVEAKESDTKLAKSLAAIKDKVHSPLAFQVVNQKGYCAQKGKGLFVLGADRFASLLP